MKDDNSEPDINNLPNDLFLMKYMLENAEIDYEVITEGENTILELTMSGIQLKFDLNEKLFDVEDPFF